MRILLGGLPLKLRARITGELTQAEVVAANNCEELSQALELRPAMALVLHENLSPKPILEYLAELRATFAGLLILIRTSGRSSGFLKTVVAVLVVS